MKDNLKYTEKIKRNILNNTLDSAALAFSFLMDFGEMTVEAFLRPSMYADLPTKNLRFSLQDKKPKEVTIRQTLSRMEKHGFIKKENGKYSLTLVGDNIAKHILKRKKLFAKKWDKKYRVVVFDIPEKKKQFRNWLRNELYILKYRKLQESVFVGKFPLPEDFIKEINHKKLSKNIDYLLVDKIYSKLDK
ncbi:MAG: hypothetical protein UT50_C0002G0048 [Candidatus Moranbacteria bacterium GW2011_GWA2_39_41]|nr:MAG: hypothetical protein UT50_C0002G0048 [Candidatus Moranbacteria bacterium GW2011_GWA2_39_41]